MNTNLGSGVRKSQKTWVWMWTLQVTTYVISGKSYTTSPSLSLFISEMEIISYLWGPLWGLRKCLCNDTRPEAQHQWEARRVNTPLRRSSNRTGVGFALVHAAWWWVTTQHGIAGSRYNVEGIIALLWDDNNMGICSGFSKRKNEFSIKLRK